MKLIQSEIWRLLFSLTTGRKCFLFAVHWRIHPSSWDNLFIKGQSNFIIKWLMSSHQPTVIRTTVLIQCQNKKTLRKAIVTWRVKPVQTVWCPSVWSEKDYSQNKTHQDCLRMGSLVCGAYIIPVKVKPGQLDPVPNWSQNETEGENLLSYVEIKMFASQRNCCFK